MNLARIAKASIGITMLTACLSGCGGDDNKSNGTTGTPPAAPSDLMAEPLPGPAIHVSWQDHSDNEENFILERKVEDGAYSVLMTMEFNTTAHHDSEVMSGKKYTYRVSAKNKAGSSAYSNEQSATAP